MSRYALHVRLLGVPTPERNSRRHWRVTRKEIQTWRRAVAFAVRGRQPPTPLGCARVVFTRHGERKLDYTNLVESFKPIEDGLVRAGVLEDDREENYIGGHPEYRQERAPRAAQFVTIDVTGETDRAETAVHHADRSGHQEGRESR